MVGPYPCRFATRRLYGFWSLQSHAAGTYPSGCRNPQALARAVALARRYLKKSLARAEHGQLVGRDRARTITPHVVAAPKRDWRPAQERAPGLLVFGRALPQRKPNRGVLRDLLREIAIDARKIGEALRREHARHT